MSWQVSTVMWCRSMTRPRTISIHISITRTGIVVFQCSKRSFKTASDMYLNCSKTKMICILVFLNYHLSLVSSWLCALAWAFVLWSSPSTKPSCDFICVLAKSCDICPLSSSATTLLFSTQVSPWNSPSYSLIATTGLFSFPKVISYSYALRIPRSPSMPKSRQRLW